MAAGTLAIALAAPVSASAAATVDELTSSCPSAAEIAQANADFSLSFEGDPTAPQLVCTSAEGSGNLTRLQERVYQALKAMRAISFVKPLPWTSQSLYDWLNSAIVGIRFRNDISGSFCCNPTGMLNIQTQNSAALTPPFDWSALRGLFDVIVHEARHAQGGYGHYCDGIDDQSWADQGAWAVETWLRKWQGLFAGDFLDAPGSAPAPSSYREQSLDSAKLFATRICTSPRADFETTAAVPASALTGSQVAFEVTLRNHGPDAAPNTYLSYDPLPGLGFASAQTSQGPCLSPAQTGGGPVVCELGSLPAGASVTANLVYTVTAPAGSTIGSRALGNPRAIADAIDPSPSNDSPDVFIRVPGSPLVSTSGPSWTDGGRRNVVVNPGISLTCAAEGLACSADETATAKVGSTGKSEKKRVTVGGAQFAIPAGGQRVLRFKLNQKGARLLRERERMRIAVTVVSREGEGIPGTTSKTITIKYPKR